MKGRRDRAAAQRAGSGGAARYHAVQILMRWATSRRPLEGLLHDVLPAELSDRDEALCRELVDGVLRQVRLLDFRLAQVVDRPLEAVDPPLLWNLRVAAYQVDFLRIPDYAAVDEAVSLCYRLKRRYAASFVNAVLRRYLRLGAPTPEPKDARSAAVAYSHPDWYVRRLFERYGGETAVRMLAENNLRPPSVLWVNPFRNTCGEFCGELLQAGVPFQKADLPDCLVIRKKGFVNHRLYLEGRCLFLNYGSLWVAHLVAVEKCRFIVDACAAPGGKSFVLRSRGSAARLLACDVDPRRLAEMRRLAESLAVPGIEFVLADGTAGFPGRGYDFVLVDVPCSGLGTIRSNPDLRWRVREEDLPRWASRQLAILQRAFAGLARGGELLYSTCSTEPEENEQVVATFLEQEREARLLEEPRRTFPEGGWADGFFAARLRRI
ncbi:MAG: 16S rRNA (cytosine(967)-C(5))-methyltransferase RsmB [Acidobacteriota bacterium]